MTWALVVRLHHSPIRTKSPPSSPYPPLVSRYSPWFPQRPMPVLHGSLRSRPWCVSFPLFTSVLSRTTLPGLSPPPFCVAPLRDSFLIRFVFSPRRVRLRFPQLSPQIRSSSLRRICSFVVLPHPYRPQATRCVPGFSRPVPPLRSLGSVFVARGRCRSPPTPLPRSGKVNRVRGSP